MSKPMTEISFRLNLDHDDFSSEVKSQFVTDFAALTNTNPDDIKILSVRVGCINLRMRVTDEAARAFLKIFRDYINNDKDLESCSPEVRNFLSQYAVEDYVRYMSDVVFVMKPEPTKRVVIFVHGWSGGQDTFANWPDYIYDKYDCGAPVFPYPTGLITSSPSITHVADGLKNWVQNRFADARLAFIAHSLGGLVVRKFVISAFDSRDRLDMHVRNLAFVASPHNGSALARAGSIIPGLRSQQLSDLSGNSPILHDLNKRWLRWVKQYVPGSCNLMSLYGTNDSVVSTVNTIGTDEDAVPILGGSHSDIVKPESRSDEIVLTIERFLESTRFFDADDTSPPAVQSTREA